MTHIAKKDAASIHIHCAQPFYKERRANQPRVRSPEWRVIAHPCCQKPRKLPSRCLPASHPVRQLSTTQPWLWLSPVRAQTLPPRNHFGEIRNCNCPKLVALQNVTE